MKILMCQHCEDGVILDPDEQRSCRCGSASGRYTSPQTVEITNGYVIGLNNTYVKALLEGVLSQGSDIPAFSIARTSPHITVAARTP